MRSTTGSVAADFSLLHLPRKVPPSDTKAYLRSAIAWHFGEDTGSPYWLRTAKKLDFDPPTGITTFSDLRLFPNLVDELRSVPVEDLNPRATSHRRRCPRYSNQVAPLGRPNGRFNCRTGLSKLCTGKLRTSPQAGSSQVVDCSASCRAGRTESATSRVWSPSSWDRSITPSTWIRAG